jgi:hypothetical protein
MLLREVDDARLDGLFEGGCQSLTRAVAYPLHHEIYAIGSIVDREADFDAMFVYLFDRCAEEEILQSRP